ncbi:MAG: DUF2784 family protein [Gemmataceae bacterium]|nr:DUF2784 family protein [Gemmataceae bacterium]
MLYKLLADCVVAVHLAYVGFVVVAQVLILIGLLLRWQWVRNVRFRVIHLVMVEVVALEGWFGIICPMTEWDTQLRAHVRVDGNAGEQPGEPVTAPPTIPEAPMPESPMPESPMPMAPVARPPMPAPMPAPPESEPVVPQAESAPPPAKEEEPAAGDGEATFVGRLLSSILYLEVPQRVLDTWYVRFGLVTLGLFVLFPPRLGRWSVSGLAGVILIWTGGLFGCAAYHERISRPEPPPDHLAADSPHRVAPLEFGIWMIALGAACCGVHCLCRSQGTQAADPQPINPS